MKMHKQESAIGLSALMVRTAAKESDRRIINCDACLLAKHAMLPIPIFSRERATKVGECVHMDICGPVGAETVAGSKYFLLLKDEFSNYRFIYFMKTREEAYDNIKDCVAQVFADTGRRVIRVMSDNGSEFSSRRTQAFFKEKEITYLRSIPVLLRETIEQ